MSADGWISAGVFSPASACASHDPHTRTVVADGYEKITALTAVVSARGTKHRRALYNCTDDGRIVIQKANDLIIKVMHQVMPIDKTITAHTGNNRTFHSRYFQNPVLARCLLKRAFWRRAG